MKTIEKRIRDLEESSKIHNEYLIKNQSILEGIVKQQARLTEASQMLTDALDKIESGKYM